MAMANCTFVVTGGPWYSGQNSIEVISTPFCNCIIAIALHI